MIKPTKLEWSKAVAKGFRPNGSTFSPDHVWGILIGNSCSNYKYSTLPANLHDYRYNQGGKTKADRLVADREFLENLIEKVSILGGIVGKLSKVRCHTYYYMVRLFGGSHYNWK